MQRALSEEYVRKYGQVDPYNHPTERVKEMLKDMKVHTHIDRERERERERG